jgi:hypothetical protein
MARLRTLGVLLLVLVVGALIGSAVAQHFGGVGVSSDPTPPAPRVQITDRVRVEVLNAGGRDGMARAATDILREHGLDVVAFHNAPNFSDQPSVVIDRVGRRDYVRVVGDLLGIDAYESDPDPTLLLEVTVRIGRDWSPQAITPADSVSPRRPWWDPRRYIGGRETPAAGE